MKPPHLSLWLPLTLALGALACGLPGSTTIAPSAVASEVVGGEAEPEASPMVAPETDVAAVVVRPDYIDLYRLDGTLADTRDAPGIDWPRPDWVQVVGSSVYYLDDAGQVRAVSAEGTTEFAFTGRPGLSAFAVSPDQAWLSWATSTFTDKVES